MSWLNPFRPKAFVSTHAITDVQLRAGAELIDDHVGKKGDHIVTGADIRETRTLIRKHDDFVARAKDEKSPFAGLMQVEIDLIRNSVDRLEKLLEDKKPNVGNRVFCTSLRVDAIRDPKTMRVAKLIASNVGSGDSQINVSEVDTVARAIAARTKGEPLTDVQNNLLAMLDNAASNNEFDMNHFADIYTYMMTGKGGLVQHGPIFVTGKRFDEVYKLQTPQTLDWADPAAVGAMLDDFERRFKSSGFDRVYVRSSEGELFVALNEKGALKRVQNDFNAGVRRDGETVDSGQVLRAVDVDNSWREAVFGFWGKIVRTLVEGMRERFSKEDTGSAIAAAADTVEGPKRVQLKQMLLAGSVVAGMGVATINVPAAFLITGVVSALATGANVVEMLRVGRDKLPILHAAGVTVNRDEAVNH